MKPDMMLAGVFAKKHSFTLPLNYQQPIGEQITVFARELCAIENKDKKLPYIVFFQGGPGFAAMRPAGNSGWIRRALKEFRVLLLDQRGTGLSSPINYQSLAHLTPAQQAAYLSHFRADNIVRDAEAIRTQLCPADKWAILGQSFGGFCVLHYLSAAPQGVSEAYITGGIPSLTRSSDEVYQATYQRVLAKNKDFFHRFHDAQHLVTRLAKHLLENSVYLATGEHLTVEMLQLLGINLGMEQGPESVYYLLEQALVRTPQGEYVNPLFLNHFCQLLDYNTNPIFALLHEAIYCQHNASQWSAHRVREQYPAFNYKIGKPFLFTGEMIYPWMFEQFSHLVPLKAAAELLADKADWPALYDLEQLSNNRVPVAAAIYSEDMYVEMNYSLETVKRVANLRYWLTSEYEHNGIRMDGERILDKLISLNRGDILR
ncbi:alpha/beta fold hydrolase [Shewanella oneidensis MR-1]|uniref:Proline iminopeptidase Pip n=1 Tax=Shewanella oneidensis (strain ATCC 700550 / JCM 31522 / CIP 106686 / LMG 19005 / NCIMB 14063 / MR-1) TaxID=211586 RepID=Q8ECS7_SHEON|nr:alpha/beta fold hydrolase [Shewanella oneidensis]AAN56064.2 proline iminopeptidase Pip [Shewanella oneidensis MR-1]MDX5999503.1 alpha/beta fold hydrolase [Shewanella oneidensis]MEE2028175.1 Proline iminopeptidase [Shewanella oneidensis]QKG97500.1 alpha/beta fold hydrolase [Shewanella oneidensis MR-1]